MKKLVDLLPDSQIGLWCKRAAWIILVIGLVEVGLGMYTNMRLFLIGQPLSLPVLLQGLQFGLGYLSSTFVSSMLPQRSPLASPVRRTGTREGEDQGAV